MIAATYTQGSGRFAVEDAARPTAGAGELLVRVMASSICGTDVRIIRNGHRKLRDGQKIILGHEFVGLIEQVGADVKDFRAGMRVGVAPNVGCGHCGMCIRGRANYCPDYEAFGITFDGAHAEYVRVTARCIQQGNVTILPDGLGWVEGSLIEPLSCAVNGINNCRIEPGESVAVFGCGPIGLLLIQLAALRGAAKVLAADPDAERLAAAKTVGASACLDPGKADVGREISAATGGAGVDVAIVACSSSSVQAQALEYLAPFGRLLLFGGLPKGHSVVELDTNLIHYRNLMVTGVTGGAPADYRTAMRLLAEGAIDTGPSVSHVLPRGRMAEAFDLALSGKAMKVVIVNES